MYDYFAQDENKPHEPNWFEKMDGYLNWKIIGPDIKNPFSPYMSDKMLADIAYRDEAIRAHLILKCMCDGYEIMTIRNLSQPFFKTDHPCITMLSREEIFEFIERSGIEEKIALEAKRLQDEIREELKKREIAEVQSNAIKDRKTLLSKKFNSTSKKKSEKSIADSNYRVVRK